MLLHVGGTSFSGTGGFTRLNISVKHVFDMFFPPIMSHQNPLFKGCMFLAPKPFYLKDYTFFKGTKTSN